jgi:hypothetical protein
LDFYLKPYVQGIYEYITQANDGNVFHYRDKSGLEADLIVSLKDGRWQLLK